jgi:hypothetical protein
VKALPLTQGYVALVNDEDDGELSRTRGYAQDRGRFGGYAFRQHNSTTLFMQRHLMPHAPSVEHIDGNPPQPPASKPARPRAPGAERGQSDHERRKQHEWLPGCPTPVRQPQEALGRHGAAVCRATALRAVA